MDIHHFAQEHFAAPASTPSAQTRLTPLIACCVSLASTYSHWTCALMVLLLLLLPSRRTNHRTNHCKIHRTQTKRLNEYNINQTHISDAVTLPIYTCQPATKSFLFQTPGTSSIRMHICTWFS